MENTGDTPPSNATILRSAAAIERASEAAIEACKACDGFASQKISTILEAETIRKDSQRTFEAAKLRAMNAAMQTAKFVQQALVQKNKVTKSLAPPLFKRTQESLFKKYDVDED